MVNILRRYQHPLMVLVTVITTISFVWLYNNTRSFDKIGADRVGEIYGRTVVQADYLRAARKFEICQMLNLTDLWSSLGFSGKMGSRNDFEENFVWNSFVLRHEADALNIVPQEQEVIATIQALPFFQTNGAYDSTKYNNFVHNALIPRGFTTDQFEEIIADSLRLQKIKAVLAATTPSLPAELHALYEKRSRKTEASVIRLKMEDFSKDLQVSEADLKERFGQQAATLLIPEKRTVKFAAFVLKPDQKSLPPKDRVSAMQKLADQASELAVAMTLKDAKFEEAATKLGATVAESPAFSQDQAPAELGSSEEIAAAAFRLTAEEPNSDVVTVETSGYYVLQLGQIIPAKPMTFEEAKARLTAEMTSERAKEALGLKAADLRVKITTAVQLGKPFADAAKEAGATVEAVPAFSAAEPKFEIADAQEIMGRATDMAEGQLSEFIPTSTGGLLLHIDKRLPLDEAGFEKDKALLAYNVDRNKTEGAFQLWLKERRGDAGLAGATKG